MTLNLFGPPEPAPEEPVPGGRRRLWFVAAGVVALILLGGSATYLLLTAGHPDRSAAVPGTYTPPVDAGTPIDPSSGAPGTSPSASPSATPGRSASPTPSHSGTTPPTGGPGAPVPVTYHVPGDLCPATDLTPVKKDGDGTPSGDHTDYPSSNYTNYFCKGTFGKVTMRVDANVFADPQAAAARFANDHGGVGGEPVGGVGSQAFGTVAKGGGPYSLYVLDGNLEMKVWLNAAGGVPTPAALRQTAIDTVNGTLPRLRG